MYKFALHKFDHIWLSVIDNEYMFNVINFVKYTFDKIEHVNSIIMIGINYNEIMPEYRKLYPEKKLIIYNWEQLVDGNHWINIPYLCESMKGADEIWDYNDLNVKYLELYHNIKVDKIYPFTYYPEIEKLTYKEEPTIDILFYGGFNQRRAKLIASLWEQFYNKYNVIVMFGQSITENFNYIENSKIILNLHGLEPWSRQEQERIGFLVGNKKCVISEWSQENYFGGAILEARPEHIASVIEYAMNNENWKKLGDKGYQTFKENNCIKIVNFE